jgi:large subunit ribosomal protein L19
MQQLIKLVEDTQLKKDLPAFKAGDTIAVAVKITEGAKERIQNYEGVVLQRRGSGLTETMTVRKISNGIGVERIFPIHSPSVDSIRVVRRGRVRRARIFYMRKRFGKAARIRELVAAK